MTGGFGVEPGDLDAAAGGFAAAAGDLARAVSALHGTLAGLGNFCGGDEEGRRFAAGYDPQVAEADRALDTLVRAMEAIPGALTAAAAVYRARDGATAGGLGGPP